MMACPLLAPSGHRCLHCEYPLSGVKRTSPIAVQMSANDPKRTLICCGRRFKALSIRPPMHLLGLRLDYPCDRVIVQPEFAKIAPLRSRVKRTRRRTWKIDSSDAASSAQRKSDEARDLLAPVYGAFTEGFPSPKTSPVGPLSLGSHTGALLRRLRHKPTLNVVPPRGHTIPSTTPREADLAMVGPMARSAG
jgi:hypothetical protein